MGAERSHTTSSGSPRSSLRNRMTSAMRRASTTITLSKGTLSRQSSKQSLKESLKVNPSPAHAPSTSDSKQPKSCRRVSRTGSGSGGRRDGAHRSLAPRKRGHRRRAYPGTHTGSRTCARAGYCFSGASRRIPACQEPRCYTLQDSVFYGADLCASSQNRVGPRSCPLA